MRVYTPFILALLFLTAASTPGFAQTVKVQAKKSTGKYILLSRFQTRFAPQNAKRAHNVRLALQKLNGHTVAPGQVFSLNAVVGPRDHSNGFLTAPVMEKGKVVPGIGGGVSQVTGTLFNAALLAGLPIVEYHNHARPVAYLPVGRDATVAWKLLDMRFRNTTGKPLKLVGRSRGNNAIVALYGVRSSQAKVSVSVRTKREGKQRIVAVLYRTFRKAGKVIKKERVGRVDYHWGADRSD